MKHEIKTEEHYNFLKSYFTFNTSLEDYLKSSSQVLCCRKDEQLIGLTCFKIIDNYVRIYYSLIKEDYRGQGFGSELRATLIDMYHPKTIFITAVRESNIINRKLLKKFDFIEIDRTVYSDGEVKLIMKRDGT